MRDRATVLDRHHVTVTGRADGPTMVFVHGFGCDQRIWRHVAPAFHVDHQVVLYDHAGAGRSDTDTFDASRHATLHGYATDLVELIDELGLGDVVLVGHSVGAIIGALATIAAPERFAQLAMVSPSPCYLDDDDYTGGFVRADIDELLATMDANYLGWTSAMASRVAGEGNTQDADELQASFCRTDPAIAQHFARTTFLADNRADLPNVPVPCLVLQVTHDAIAPTAVGHYVADHVPAGRYVEIDTVGHCPHLSAPEQTIAALRAFL